MKDFISNFSKQVKKLYKDREAEKVRKVSKYQISGRVFLPYYKKDQIAMKLYSGKSDVFFFF